MTAQWVLIVLLGAVAVDAFAAELTAAAPGWSVAAIVAFFVGLAGVIAAIATAAVKIITALRETKVALAETKRIVVAGQIAAVAANVVSTQAQNQIHLLVNSNLLVKMRGMLVMLRREYERTKKDSDREAIEVAEKELHETEASALTVSNLQVNQERDNRDSAATAELEAGRARAGEVFDPVKQWILSLERVVALTKETYERTKSPADATLYQQARDALALAQKMK